MEQIKEKFAAMGARIQFSEMKSGSRPLVVDVARDKKGEYFRVNINPAQNVELTVQDVQKRLRHLLLVARFMPDGRIYGEKDAISILCGHDEREWFAALLPENASSVRGAFDKLKPETVRDNQHRLRVKMKNWNKRKNAGFIRQGEFFFIKEDIDVDINMILRNEPLLMGGGTPHMAQFAYRAGGTTVYVSRIYPNGVTAREYRHIMASEPRAKSYAWQTMTRDATLYVKGDIRHPDHATIHLDGWHRVVVNGELRGREVVFLD